MHIPKERDDRLQKATSRPRHFHAPCSVLMRAFDVLSAVHAVANEAAPNSRGVVVVVRLVLVECATMAKALGVAPQVQ